MKHNFAVVFYNGDQEYLLVVNKTYAEVLINDEVVAGKVSYIDSFELQQIGLEDEDGLNTYISCDDITEVLNVSSI
ncbi:hypothetical protein PPOLYM_01672 [Paenibacillus polymyxa]|uniref:hypothetical protein n=1 Tax=Paenibacillus polymyxa TaxID=1406 RepID=UPI0009477C3D|nr:hypothetical protein [Paenibacillus polymyxa]APQ60458.1 hypothetical protein VK72_17865 [Paenibacillus polymyxa]VUG05292.1 hypothetical protein PPOLYM_01672 [Paenibacillus polymyxa]